MAKNHKKLFLSLFATLLVPVALLACGTEKIAKLNRRDADNTSKAKLTLDVSSSLMKVKDTSSNKHSLTTTLSLRPENYLLPSEAFSSFVTTVTVTSPSGTKIPVLNSSLKPIADGSQTGATAKWEIMLTDEKGNADGEYTIDIVTSAPKGTPNISDVSLPDPWSTKIKLDSMQPVVGLQSEIIRRFPEGIRYLTAFAWVGNEKEAECSGGELRTADLGKTLEVRFSPVKDPSILAKLKLQAGTPLVAATDLPLPLDMREPFTLFVKCKDAAGNHSEFIQPVGVSTPSFNFTAKTEGTEAKIPNTSRDAIFVKSGAIKMNFSLSDLSSGQALSNNYVSSLASNLRVFITEKSPVDIEDLLAMKTVIWSQQYADSTSLPLPPSYDGEVTIYATVVLQDVTKNKQILVRTIPVRLFVATKPSVISWMSPAQFVPFAANTPISGKFRVTSVQAPLSESAPITLEYTTNKESWLPLPAELSQAGTPTDPPDSKTFSYRFPYPLSSEQAFRIRVKAKDIAGNVAISSISPNLLGQPNLALSVVQSERNACTVNGTAASKFKPWLASSVLCQTADVTGQTSGLHHVQILLQNRGSANIGFYSTTAIPPGMGYRVLVDGVQVEQNRILGNVINDISQPPPLFILAPDGSIKLLNFAIQDQWLMGNKVVIEFDREDTGANSIANSCYLQGSDFPSIVVQDKAMGLIPKRSPMPCDTL
jgi:hypothetical protein